MKTLEYALELYRHKLDDMTRLCRQIEMDFPGRLSVDQIAELRDMERICSGQLAMPCFAKGADE